MNSAYPQWIVLQLVEACNLRCAMCYEWGVAGSYHGKESLAVLEFSVIERILGECGPSRPHIDLFGGEPLLHPRIGDVIKAIKNKGCVLDIPTNGLLVGPNAGMLVEAQVDRLWISLDGPDKINDTQRGKGVFQKVMQGIRELRRVREKEKSDFPKLGITYVVTALNHAYLENFFFRSMDISQLDHVSIEFQTFITDIHYERYTEFIKKEFGVGIAPSARGYIVDVRQFKDMDFSEMSRQIERIREFSEANNKYLVVHPQTTTPKNIESYFKADWKSLENHRAFCPFPWLHLEISARGEAFTCHAFHDLPIGNIYNQSLLEIWNGEKINAVRQYLRRNTLPVCPACCLFHCNGVPSGKGKDDS
jgi:MoaA/NifB/PqqE/SkfB family radical SAM enzyme